MQISLLGRRRVHDGRRDFRDSPGHSFVPSRHSIIPALGSVNYSGNSKTRALVFFFFFFFSFGPPLARAQASSPSDLVFTISKIALLWLFEVDGVTSARHILRSSSARPQRSSPPDPALLYLDLPFLACFSAHYYPYLARLCVTCHVTHKRAKYG